MIAAPAPLIQFVGDRLRVVWDGFSAGPAYELFKQVKRLPEYDVVLDEEGIASGITAPARFAPLLGVAAKEVVANWLPMPEWLFDDQAAITRMALDAKRFAIWSDCGLGKTVDGLEFARQVTRRTGGRVLIVTLNEIVGQWLDEAAERYGGQLKIVRLESREEMKRWCAGATLTPETTDEITSGDGGDSCLQTHEPDGGGGGVSEVDDAADGGERRSFRNGRRSLSPVRTKRESEKQEGSRDAAPCDRANHSGGIRTALQAAHIAVVNYEKFNHRDPADQVVSELRLLAGIVLDESSRLKTGGGTQKWALIKSARGIEYKLSLTATPAPNELMEFASQASFLERMRSDSINDAAQQIIWTYFTRDSKTHRWTIKKHARRAFFEWMASWSIYVRDPKKYGWRMNWTPPPEPEYIRHEIAITDEQRQIVMDFNSDPANTSEANLGSMFAGEMNAIAATKLSQAAKGFIYKKGAARVSRDTSNARGSGVPAADRAGGVAAEVSAEVPADGGTASDHRSGAGFGRPAGGTESNPKLPVRKAAAVRRVQPVESLKPAFVADLIATEMLAGRQVLVWTIFDEEIAILAKHLMAHPKLKRGNYRADRDIDWLSGKTSDDDRLSILKDFKAGKCRTLITRAQMLGYGMNLQFVQSMIFSGWSFSYEQFYQAVRRAYRHGQMQSVRVHLPVIPELEGQMYDAIVRKQKQHEEAITEMEVNYVNARAELAGMKEKAS